MNFDQDITKATETLKSGGTILYPTDTIWGIGCDATREDAVKKVYAIKKRPEAKSLILLVSDVQMLNRYVDEVPQVAWDLIELSEKPITIIYPKARGIAKNAIAEDGSVAIRLTKDEFCTKLIRKFNKPIVSTSANFSDTPAALNFSEINHHLVSEIDYVVSFRQNDLSKCQASSIIKLGMNGDVVVIRK